MFTVDRIGTLPIFHAHTSNRTLLALAFLRMQEYYESPKFRGKPFSLDEYKAWYTAERDSFSYASDWSGFNVPSDVVREIIWNFSGHSEEEQLLFKALGEKCVFAFKRFYLIGSSGTHTETLYHELCHALYYLDSEYRASAECVTRQFDLATFRQFLLKKGYASEVIDDEIHAYAMSNLPKGVTRTRKLRLYRRELKTALRPFLARYFQTVP